MALIEAFGCATAPPGKPVDWAQQTKDRLD
jgi:hypothetical protein